MSIPTPSKYIKLRDGELEELIRAVTDTSEAVHGTLPAHSLVRQGTGPIVLAKLAELRGVHVDEI